MVLISSKKYACETCIKGHRSSSCQHTDRPLYEIKKKGRPVTQCEHCRELRKTKQVHVKCICQKVDVNATASTSGKKGVSKMLESAAFPNGLPEVLEASVALQLLSEGMSSDSDHGAGCTCKSKGDCNCCTPRKSVPRSRKKEISPPSRPSAASVDAIAPTPGSEFSAPDHTQSSSHVLSRIAELRPVLPKPSRRSGDIFIDGPVHDPSTSGLGGLNRHHVHELYSPYGRAYDNTHPNGHSHAYQQTHPQLELDIPKYTSTRNIPCDIRDTEYNLPTQNNFSFVSPNEPARSPDPGSNAVETDVWNVFQQYGVLCGCGDACACPNCLTHRGANIPVTTPNNTPTNSPSHAPRTSCVNPDSCGACVECLMFPPSFSFSTSAGVADVLNGMNNVGSTSSNASDINQWLASLPQTALDSIMSGPVPPFQLSPAVESDERLQPRRESPSCSCPPGLCQCNDCNGRCQSTLTGQGYDERRASPSFSSSFGNGYSSDDPMYTEFSGQVRQLRMDVGQPPSVWEAVDTNDFDFWNPSQGLDPLIAMKRTRSGSSSSSEASSHLSRFSADHPSSPVFSDGPPSAHSSQESLHGIQKTGFNQGMGMQEFY